MEVAIIDWKSLDSKFVSDDLYEHINAPKWIDFSAPDHSIDDEAWFCRPECNHPKTVEDFLKQTPTSKHQRSASVSDIPPLGDGNRRDATLKKRGLAQPSFSKCDKFVGDSENQNPNSSTPPNLKAKFMKETIKSSTEKKQVNNSPPRLKSTLSARNLFAGKDILNQITEFCNELKRLAMRAKEKEAVEKSPVGVKKQEVVKEERKPLLEVSKEKCESMEKSSNAKEKQRRKKRIDDAENNRPIPLDLKNIKRKGGESLLQIRTCPPSPQCFSANRGPTKATPPPKAFRSRPPERGILKELEQSNKELREEEPRNRDNQEEALPVIAEKEAKTLDVFWFLKPCTLSS